MKSARLLIPRWTLIPAGAFWVGGPFHSPPSHFVKGKLEPRLGRFITHSGRLPTASMSRCLPCLNRSPGGMLRKHLDQLRSTKGTRSSSKPTGHAHDVAISEELVSHVRGSSRIAADGFEKGIVVGGFSRCRFLFEKGRRICSPSPCFALAGNGATTLRPLQFGEACFLRDDETRDSYSGTDGVSLVEKPGLALR